MQTVMPSVSLSLRVVPTAAVMALSFAIAAPAQQAGNSGQTLPGQASQQAQSSAEQRLPDQASTQAQVATDDTGSGFNAWLARNFGITDAATLGVDQLEDGSFAVEVMGTDATGSTITTTVNTTNLGG